MLQAFISMVFKIGKSNFYSLPTFNKIWQTLSLPNQNLSIEDNTKSNASKVLSVQIEPLLSQIFLSL